MASAASSFRSSASRRSIFWSPPCTSREEESHAEGNPSRNRVGGRVDRHHGSRLPARDDGHCGRYLPLDRKSTRLNSSHLGSSYAVFCLKKKTITLYLVV